MNRKLTTVMLIFAVTAFIWNILPCAEWIPELSYCLYCAAVIIWGLTINYRIVQKNIRELLIMASTFLISLFIMRLCRHEFFAQSYVLREYMHYAYHVSFTVVSTISLMIALCVGRDEKEQPLRYARYIWIPELLICAFILTNSFHQQMFGLMPYPSEEYTYHWFYYFTVVNELLLGAASLVIMLHRCLISASRRRWYIPVIFVFFGVVLLMTILIRNGAPELNGVPIYNLQEAFAFLFISGYEGAIRIGLIPSNTDYEEIFFLSHINAAIFDREHEKMFASQGYRDHSGLNNRVRMESISGGDVMWIEDLGTINRLNEELLQITELVEEENDLIRQENELRQERIGYETRNRLYDRIALSVRPQALQVDRLLQDADGEEEMRGNLQMAVILGTYIKRLGNLLLIADEHSMISTEELCISIMESFEYLTLSGFACDLVENAVLELPSDAVIFAYALFEHVIESSYHFMYACIITFSLTEDDSVFSMRIAVDADRKPDLSILAQNGVKSVGSVSQTFEDGTFYITLEIPRGEVSA